MTNATGHTVERYIGTRGRSSATYPSSRFAGILSWTWNLGGTALRKATLRSRPGQEEGRWLVMSMNPSRRVTDSLRLSDLAVDNRIVTVRCVLCRTAYHYLAQ